MDLKAAFPLGQKVDVFVTHVQEETGDFFVQLNNEEAGKLDELMAEIERFISDEGSQGPTAGDIKIGRVYLAQYSEDARWYRARVLTVKDGICEVYFIDYGNTEQIPIKFLRIAKPSFLDLPPQAYECVLEDIGRLTGPNFKDAVSALKDLILEQELSCVTRSINDNTLIVNLYKDTNCQDCILSHLLSQVQRTPQTSTLNDEEPPGALAKKCFRNTSLSKGSYIDVCVTDVQDPHSFSCQFVKGSEKLLDLMDEIANDYEGLKQGELPLQSSSVGYPCCAKFTEDFCWYRAVITKSSAVSSGFLDVKFVDYGNVQTTPVSDVKELKAKFLDLPPQTVECALLGIAPENKIKGWSPDAKSLFSKLTKDKHIVAEIYDKDPDSKYWVKLVDTTGEMDMQVDQILIAAKYAVKVNTNFQDIVRLQNGERSQTYPQSTSKPQNISKRAPFPYTKEILAPGKEEKVLVSSVTSPSLFYCMLYRTSTTLEKLMSNIRRYYSRMAPEEEWLANPSIGDPCCAKFSEDQSWYRAVVTNVSTPGKVQVLFVDYGNSESVPSKSVKKLSPQFSELPCQGIKCTLNRISPKGKKHWRSTDVKTFENLALECTGKLTVIALEDEELHRVELVVHEKGKDINLAESLLLKGNATLVEGATSQSENLASVTSRKFAKLTVNIGGYEDVFVSHVEDPGHFWCQLSKHQDDLNNLMTAIHDYCTASKDVIHHASLGLACCAKYSDDQAWYRATITGIKRNNKAEIQFVDYGNYDELSLSDLRSIKPEFMELPSQAFKCRLAQLDVSTLIAYPPDAIDKFCELTVDKELVLMIESFDKTHEQYLTLLLDGTENIFDTIAPLMPDVSSKEIMVPKQEIRPGRKENVCITTVNGLSDFFCQFMCSASHLDDMMINMDAHYKALAPEQEQLPQPKVGCYCVGQYTEDNSWYRAKITGSSNSLYDVVYIDFGNGESLPASRIKKLSQSFSQLLQQGISCSLAGNKSQFSDSQFIQLTLDKVFDMEVVAIESDDKAEVELYCADTKRPFRDQLTKQQPEPLLKIEPNPLRVGTSEVAFIALASSISKFYCQLSKTADSLVDLMNKMYNYYDSLDATQDGVSNPQVGVYCAAKYTEDDCWYRAKISSVQGKNIEVFYVDYGNSEVLPLKRVKKLKPEFVQLPAQAIQCSLTNIKDFTSAASTRFIELVSDLETIFILKINSMVTENVFEVELIKKESGESVYQILANEGLMQTNDYRPCAMPLTEGGYLDVSPLICHNPHDFYCQVLSTDNIKAFGQLMSKIQDTYSKMDPNDNKLDKPEINMPCCALYTGDSSWNRGKIAQIVDENTVEVFFVDYGNQEVTNLNNVKRLLPEFIGLPVKCIQGCLTDIKPCNGTQWSDKAKERFAELVNQKQLVAKPINPGEGKKMLVSLFDTSDDTQDINIGETLVNEGLAVLASSSAAGQRPIPTLKTLESLECLKVSSGDVLYITAVDSPDRIYCQVAGTEEKLDNLMASLTAFYGSSQARELSVQSIKAGQLCAAWFSQDCAWYRALVTSVSSRNVTVRFIDYGNTDILGLDNIRTLAEEFTKDPILTVRCKLSGVQPSGGGPNWSKEATKFLENVGGDDGFEVKVISSGDISEVKLHDQQGDLSDRLVHEGLAVGRHQGVGKPVQKAKQQSSPRQSSSKLQAYQSPDVQVGRTVEVYITDVTSPGMFCCQLAEYGDDLNQMMDSIYEHYSNLEETSGCLVSPVVGQPCVAIFEGDGSWYRAVVQNMTLKDLNVKFVDYGNSQTIKPHKVKQIEPRFMKLPKMAIECAIDLQKSDWSKEETKKFRAVAGEDKMTAKIEKEENGRYLVKIYHDAECITDSFLRKPAVPEIPDQVLNPNQEEDICVVYLSNSTQLYLQLSKHSEALDELMALIDKTCRASSMPPKEETLDIGMACCALFENGWYRAVVISKPSSGRVEVHYVDYGNTAVVPISDLRALPESCHKLPKQAVACTLNDPKMSSVSKDVVENAVMYKQIKAKFLKQQGEYWIVELEIGGTSLANNFLKDSQCAESKASTLTEQSISETFHTQVYASYIVNFENFYLQLASSTEMLDSLGAKLNASCPGSEPLEKLELGSVCCAQFSEDNTWYRGIVTALPDDEHVEVQFVDYGNFDVITRSNVMVLKKEFFDIPVLAVKCSLEVSQNTKWTDEDAASFEALVCDQELEAVFLHKNADKWQVKLSKDGQSLVNLFQENQEKVPEDASVSHVLTSIEDKEINAGQELDCCLSHIEETGSFYIHTNADPLLDKITNMISEIYPSLSPLDGCLGECKVGSFCCVKFSEDDQWYRAVVNEVLSDSQAKVTFVDFGNSEVTAISSMKSLRPELLEIPKLAIHCRLDRAKDNWPEADTLMLEEKMLEKTLKVKFVSADQHWWNVIVDVDGTCLNTLPEFAAADGQLCSFTATSFTVNKKEPVIFLAAESLNCMWVQPKNTANELSALMNEIAEIKPNKTMEASEISVGKPCLAKFTEDDEWYRAEVMNTGDQILVKYVDYGNSEHIDATRISPISPSFMWLPTQAVKVSLDVAEASASHVIDKLNEEYPEMTLEAKVMNKSGDGVYVVNLFDQEGKDLAETLTYTSQNDNAETKAPVAAVDVNPIVSQDEAPAEAGDTNGRKAEELEEEEEFFEAQENVNKDVVSGSSSNSLEALPVANEASSTDGTAGDTPLQGLDDPQSKSAVAEPDESVLSGMQENSRAELPKVGGNETSVDSDVISSSNQPLCSEPGNIERAPDMMEECRPRVSSESFEDNLSESPNDKSPETKEDLPCKTLEDEAKKPLEDMPSETPKDEGHDKVPSETPKDETTDCHDKVPSETPKDETTEFQDEVSSETPKDESIEGQEDVTSETPKDESIESQEDVTSETPKDESIEGQEDVTSETPKDESIESQEDVTSETPKDEATEGQEDVTSETPKDETTEGQEDVTSETPKDESIESQEDVTSETPKDESIESQEDVTSETPKDEATEGQEDVTSETPKDETTEGHDKVPSETPKDETAEGHDKVPSETPKDETTESHDKVPSETPKDETTESHDKVPPETPKDETTEFQDEVSSETPKDESIEGQEDVTSETPKDETIEGQDEMPSKTPKDESIEGQEDVRPETPKDETIEGQEDVTSETPKDESIEGQEDVTSETPKDESIESQEDVTSETPKDEATEGQEDVTSETPKDETTEGQEDVTSETPKDESIESQDEVPSETPKDESIEVQDEVPSETPKDETTEFQDEVPSETLQDAASESHDNLSFVPNKDDSEHCLVTTGMHKSSDALGFDEDEECLSDEALEKLNNVLEHEPSTARQAPGLALVNDNVQEGI